MMMFSDQLFWFSSVGRRESHDAVRSCISMPCPGVALNEIQGHADISRDSKVNHAVSIRRSLGLHSVSVSQLSEPEVFILIIIITSEYL